MSDFTPKSDAGFGEAPIVIPKMVDLYGTAWDERPDNRVRAQVQKLGVSNDQYFHIEKMLAERKWEDLLTYLSQMERRSNEGDDKRRMEAARETVMSVIREQRSDL